ncbi:hypothetical protein DER44DRAFT_360250 [Fusarium oxysporum]|nr:hypothetical protein DER44DRAFT_360250 [Fusarium oxysporum]
MWLGRSDTRTHALFWYITLTVYGNSSQWRSSTQRHRSLVLVTDGRQVTEKSELPIVRQGTVATCCNLYWWMVVPLAQTDVVPARSHRQDGASTFDPGDIWWRTFDALAY